MENGQNASGSSWDLSLVASPDQNDEFKSIQEVMVRRMKNRERQRRYRARKRLEADRQKTDYHQLLPFPEGDTVKSITSAPLPGVINHVVSRRKKESSIIHFTPTPIQVPGNSAPVDFVTRVHSERDWKRDARRAHMIKEQNGKDSSPVMPLATPTNGSQSSSPKPDNNQERTALPGRRHWKEEARNKKS